MKIVGLIRRPCAALWMGQRTHIARTSINFTRAEKQHAHYVEALREVGIAIVEVPTAPDLADCVFIHDTALVLDSVAVIARSGAISRRPETTAVTAALSRYRHLIQLPPTAYFEGGDAVVIDRTVYVGCTTRTNSAAIAFLMTLLRQSQYQVVPVAVSGCLHLKSAVTYLGNSTVLINPEWVPRQAFANYLSIEVARGEPGAANALRVGNHLFMSTRFPRTAKRVAAHGLVPRLIDISQFHRAEGGMTCLSLLLTSHGTR